VAAVAIATTNACLPSEVLRRAAAIHKGSMGGTPSSPAPPLEGLTARWAPMRRSRLGASCTQGLAEMARVLIGRSPGVLTVHTSGRPLAVSFGRALPAPSVKEPLSACGTPLLDQGETTAKRSARSSATPIRRERLSRREVDDVGATTQSCWPRVRSHPFSATSIAKA
jgi:hypothetical protein